MLLYKDGETINQKLIKKMMISIFLLTSFIIIMYFILKHFGLTDLTQEEIQSYLNESGALAPLLFIFITFLQVTFIPIPSTITVLVGNYLFGFWVSFLYSYIGMLIGSIFAFYLGRWFGRKFINWLVSDKEIVDRYLEKVKVKGNVLLFFMFLFPFFPDDLLCSVAGVMNIRTRTFIFMQVFTRAITIIATLFMLSGDVIPFSGWGIPFNISLTILIATIFYLCFKNAEKISDYFNKIVKKIFKNRKI